MFLWWILNVRSLLTCFLCQWSRQTGTVFVLVLHVRTLRLGRGVTLAGWEVKLNPACLGEPGAE